jgi:hypothetical protein
MRRRLATPEPIQAVDTAWRIHAAHVAWIESVDNKAGFAFAVQSAIATAALLTAPGGTLSGGAGPVAMVVALAGLSAVIVGAGLSVAAVAPRLRARFPAGGVARRLPLLRPCAAPVPL